MRFFVSYIAMVMILVGLDRLWLGVVMKEKITQRLGPLMREAFAYGPAVMFYLCYGGAILYFAVLPAISKADRRLAVMNGAVLGFIAYMTYDFTNRATLKGWPIAMVLPDILRGTIVTALVAGIGYLVITKIG